MKLLCITEQEQKRILTVDKKKLIEILKSPVRMP